MKQLQSLPIRNLAQRRRVTSYNPYRSRLGDFPSIARLLHRAVDQDDGEASVLKDLNRSKQTHKSKDKEVAKAASHQGGQVSSSDLRAEGHQPAAVAEDLAFQEV